MTITRTYALVAALTALTTLIACGDDDAGGSSSGGEVTEAWEAYCIATFTQDYGVIDPFDAPLVQAKSGSRYLMSSNGSAFGTASGVRVGMFYLTPNGPEEFEVEVQSADELPLTTSCGADRAEQQLLVGVFKDTTVYADEALTQEACTLTEGTVAETSGGGFSIVGEIDILGSAPTTYQLSLGGLSPMCGDIEQGYVRVNATQIFGYSTYLVPIRTFIGPPS